MRGAEVGQRFRKRFIFFGRNSGIHGLHYLFDDNRSLLCRVFWLLTLIASMGCLYLMLEDAGHLGVEVNFTPDTLYLNWTTTFPAVTVCEQHSTKIALRKFTALYRKVFWLLTLIASMGCLYLMLEDAGHLGVEVNFTPDTLYLNWTTTFPAVTVCEQHSTKIALRKFTALYHLLFARGECGQAQCAPCGQTVACDVAWRSIIERVHKSCPEMVADCSYNGVAFPCCEYFRLVDSEHGPCFSFNTLQHKGDNSLFVVNMTTGPGVLMFRLLSNAEISIHSSEELSTNNLDGKLKQLVHTLSENQVGFLFSVVEMENDEQLQRKDVYERQCRYLHEIPDIPLHTYPVYSYGACQLAYTTKEFYQQCGCIHPVRDLTSHKTKVGEEIKTADDCLPSCVESELKILHYTRRWIRDATFEGTLVEVKMASLPTLRYQRNLLRDNLDLVGGGLLVDMMKRALQNKQYAEIDHAIKTKVEPFLYNKGKGRYIPISHLVLLRNKERPRHKLLPPLRSMENPDEEFDVEKDWPLVTQEEYDANPSGYRELCWDLKMRSFIAIILASIVGIRMKPTKLKLVRKLKRQMIACHLVLRVNLKFCIIPGDGYAMQLLKVLW
uniref:Uncharacterized protein n=1 Tax=Heliothis virescens TaxID=7102 RepID=A0A2A4JGG5_HELVI